MAFDMFLIVFNMMAFCGDRDMALLDIGYMDKAC